MLNKKSDRSKLQKKSNPDLNLNQVTLKNARFWIKKLLEELESTQRKFEIEKNIKNSLYAFISEMGFRSAIAERNGYG
jgi:hypothetical protein